MDHYATHTFILGADDQPVIDWHGDTVSMTVYHPICGGVALHMTTAHIPSVEELLRVLRTLKQSDPSPQIPRCACCGKPSRRLERQNLCLACSLLGEEETDESECWNYPEQQWDT